MFSLLRLSYVHCKEDITIHNDLLYGELTAGSSFLNALIFYLKTSGTVI